MYDSPLFFSDSNAKLRGQGTLTFSLPSGHTCPGADECLAKFDRSSGKLIDGKNQKFRCFSASLESAFHAFRRKADHNLRLLKQAETESAMSKLIEDSLPSPSFLSWPRIRIHVGGDFFNASYFRAWCRVAGADPSRLYYAYTKSLSIWVANMEVIPDNLVLTASWGGRWDALIGEYGLKSARVVYHPEQAEAMGLPIDKDDSYARDPNSGDFALLLHGTQPKGTPASRAIQRMQKAGVKFSYGKK